MSNVETTARPPRMLAMLPTGNHLFWTSGSTGKLQLHREISTGRWVNPFSAEDVDGPAFKAEAVSGKGTVFTFTVNYHAYNPAVPPPYVIALVTLDEQADLRFPTNIVNCDPESVTIGMRVKVTFEQNGDDFVPVFEPDR